jgi:hypothetical protein
LDKDDEKSEIKSKDEDLVFEPDKPSTSEDQVASVSLEECSTLEDSTDPLETSPMHQQEKKSKLSDRFC